jgi:hypothetical protein
MSDMAIFQQSIRYPHLAANKTRPSQEIIAIIRYRQTIAASAKHQW